MKVTLTVVVNPHERVVFEGRAAGGEGLSLPDARRLWEAEQAINALTDLRVHLELSDEAGGGHGD